MYSGSGPGVETSKESYVFTLSISRFWFSNGTAWYYINGNREIPTVGTPGPDVKTSEETPINTFIKLFLRPNRR